MPSERSLERVDGTNVSLQAPAAVYDLLSNRHRWAIVSALSEAQRLSTADLALEVERFAGDEPDDPTVDRTNRRLVSLHHRDLPHLEASGIVDWHREDDTVELNDHPALEDALLQAHLPPEGSAPNVRLFDALNHPIRRKAVSLVEDTGRTTIADLANALHEETDGEIDVERAHVSLVHAHLGPLADAGLLDVDRTADQVAPAERLSATIGSASQASD